MADNINVNSMLADMKKQICRLQKALGLDGSTSTVWSTGGNIVTENYFLGPTNEESLVFKTFNIERARITEEGTLDLKGQIIIRGGSPGAGKVLQSDANGTATWETPSGGSLAANNGLSVSASNAVLGQDLGALDDPAILLSHRQIPNNGHNIHLTGTGKMSIGYADTSVTPFPVLDVKGMLGVTVGSAGYPFALNSGITGIMHMSQQSGTWGLVLTRSGAASSNYGSVLTYFRTAGADANTKTALAPGQPIGSTVYQTVAANEINVANSGVVHHKLASTVGGVARGYFEFITADDNGFITTPRLTISAAGNITVGSGVTTLGESDLSKLRVHQTLIGTEAYAGIHLTPTWTTTGAPTALKVNVTDSSSDAASLLADIQLGGVSRFNISKSGHTQIIAVNGYSQLRLQTTYTPTDSADANGTTGNIAWDDNFLYIKTSAGWKRSALSTF